MLVAPGNDAMSHRRCTGFTIMQLVASVAIIGILAAVAIPGYQVYIDRARQARAIAQIAAIEIAITEFAGTNDGLAPPDLAAVDLAGAEDPWGNLIVFVNLTLGGAPRVDQAGLAVNVEYDLYSKGADGASALSLSADASRDDIVRASDGGFVGVVADYARVN